MARFGLAVIFCGIFGLMFIYHGIRRIARMFAEPKPAEAALWGGVGMMLGVACVCYVYNFLFVPDPVPSQTYPTNFDGQFLVDSTKRATTLPPVAP